ncbi:Helicase SWR1, partial [Termitomyces sp. T112]
EPTSISAPPALPRLNIKRVKLLVRRPAPPITNPKQRPPPVEYNSSVDTFLRSYFTLNGHDVKESTLEHQVQVDVSVLERAERLQKNGGFLPIFNELFQFNEENMGKSLAPPRQSNDPWDHVVEAACHIGQSWRRKSSGQQIASQWAKAIRGYWDGQEAMKERLKIQEERRLRALAKATIRMVTDEWKKAVFHIREQERLKQEADEVRRGREHLDAILDQSGQLLETQQSDLTRGELPRSRSSSMSLAGGVWGSDEEEEENEGDISSSEEEVQGEGIEERDDTNDEQDEAREDEALKSSVGSDIGEASSRVEDLEDSDAEDVETRALLGTPRSMTKILPSEIEEPHFPSVLGNETPNGLPVAAIRDLLTPEPLNSSSHPLRPLTLNIHSAAGSERDILAAPTRSMSLPSSGSIKAESLRHPSLSPSISVPIPLSILSDNPILEPDSVEEDTENYDGHQSSTSTAL